MFKRVSLAEKAFFARQLATMVNSGLALDRAIAILAGQVKNKYLAQILEVVLADLEAGQTFSAAIAKHPKVFNRVFVNVVISGEAVGKLGDVLNQLAENLASESGFNSKIISALYYPIFVLVAMFIVGAILIIKVIPQLKSIFEEAEVQLPFVTRALINVSDFLVSYWWLTLLGIVGLVLIIRIFLASSTGKTVKDSLQINAPGGIGKNLYMARFARTLGMLIQAGTPIIEAINITAEVINNGIYRDILKNAKNEVERGIPLSIPLGKSDDFPSIVPQMILVGEQTGKLDQILINLAQYYENETDSKIKGLSSLFEPIMIVIVGGGVAFLVFSIIVPIYNIAQFQ